MRDARFLALFRIEGLVRAIEAYWGFLFNDDTRWGADRLKQEVMFGQDGGAPGISVINGLLSVLAGQNKARSPLESLRITSAHSAILLAEKSLTEPLSKAELNELGWLLTKLVALDTKPIKAALLSLQVKGGVKSGESRRAGNSERDAAICRAGERLKSEGRGVRELSGIIADTETGAGLSKKQIRALLRAGNVIPAPRKKKRQ
ncbi:hypothetical protein [Pseudomonas sp. S3E12]|uniref:hypothetical protein n=1 Tax=Pseudomonas sp. S3E12 TaxID=1873126 RepID=UPI00081BD400|nr:hypothetical protein [Pseudomonas sp. S3E12]OCW21075.1 hypothetical protein BB029_23995 [Pseudomonas sp. S3E12]